MMELLKELVMAKINRPKPTVDEVEVQVWS
jgi:hypothetical protein